jgi:hypothetical protein
MTVFRLQRHAPEAQFATHCEVCGTTDVRRLTDHVQVGTPGTPDHDGGVCESCGAVLDKVVDKYGDKLTMIVDEAQHEATEREITIPGVRRQKK